MSVRVTLYTKPGCHLCEQVERKLLAVQSNAPFELLKIDIQEDPGLKSKYGLDIPVVVIEDTLFSKHNLDENLFESKIKELNRQNAYTI